jgi:signal transduction histidine kinase
VVILTNPSLYVQDSTGGILVKGSQIPPLNVGDAIEVKGHAQAGLHSAEISKVAVRLLWSGSPIPPMVVTSSQAASGAYDSRFVEVEGRFIGMKSTNGGDQVLEFTDGGQSFRVIYSGGRASSLNQPEKDSYLWVRGVCVLDRKYTQDLVPFVVMIRSPDDLHVLAGPPWWTPWHIGALTGGIIALTLLMQLLYFKIAQWKERAITQERNRLAHEIHDTMAQSFAGLGYQIQGIRSGILRGEVRESHFIADQLSATYQLVRRCHEEASRTVSMLGSSNPPAENGLLDVLADTAHRIAGDQIRTVTALQGTPFPLSIRLADALLHIGQEAIANSVTHADPAVLHVTLRYEQSNVELVVEDDGRGFDYQPSIVGFGILGMQKRVRDIGGSLNINSVPGRGTKVRVNANQRTISFRRKLLQKIEKGLHLSR